MTVLTAAAVAAIFFNSSRSAVESTEQSTPLTEWINSLLCSLNIPLTLAENLIRKLAHLTEYTILGVLLSTTVFLYLRKRLKTFLTALLIGVPVAVCDELIQLTSEGRSCEVRDMLIDTGGILIGALTVMIFISISEKRKGNL